MEIAEIASSKARMKYHILRSVVGVIFNLALLLAYLFALLLAYLHLLLLAYLNFPLATIS